MENQTWDLKSNYMLAFTICKYGLHPERWNLIVEDLANYIKTTPQNCKEQFDFLCEKYGQDWQKQRSNESLQDYVFGIIKRLYYNDLCERMTESRGLLMVMYDFIRLYQTGRLTLHDVNTILQDVQNTIPTGNSVQDTGREQKTKMLRRLKFHIEKQIPQIQHSSFPLELLPPPPFFQQPHSIIPNYLSTEQSIVPNNGNDRQVPSMNNQQKSDAKAYPVIVQSNNLLMDNIKQSSIDNNNNNNNQTNVDDDDDDDDIEEIELSSDDENEQTTTTHISNIDQPITNSNLIDDQDESTYISDDHMDTNQSSNIPPIPTEISNSNDRDLYENVSTTSISNQSTTFDTRLSTDVNGISHMNGQPISSNIPLNASISGSSDYVTLDSDRIQSTTNHHHHHHYDQARESTSNVTTPRRIPVEDDEVARMDAEQIPEAIPADITDVTVPNDNAVFVIDELDTKKSSPKVLITTNIDEQSIISENDQSMITKALQSLPPNFRKSMNSILNNLKTAKYGPDFAKPLKSFKLPDEYFIRIKKPLDIPEIRERLNKGHYDDNILLFERDILLMFTNALLMYHRDLDIHGHAQYMINYAMELLTAIEEIVTPWKTNSNENDGDSSSIFHTDNENDSMDNTSHIRTPSITSTSSSIKTFRRPQTSSNHPMAKRQRKTIH